jgi:hypothetical protein
LQVKRPIGGSAAVAGTLAVLGGMLLCFLTLHATVYEPLHQHFPVNYGEPVYFGDVLALVAGAAAIAIGVLLLVNSSNPLARGPWLLVAGVPVLIVTLLWTFPDTFHVDLYSRPFYLGFVYFTEFGLTELGSRYVQVPLICGCAMLIGAGLIVSLAPRRPAPAL